MRFEDIVVITSIHQKDLYLRFVNYNQYENLLKSLFPLLSACDTSKHPSNGGLPKIQQKIFIHY